MHKKAWLIIIAFALIKFSIPFLFIHPAFQLHRDEYLYLADADHLDWGYIEMPPLLAFLGYISKLIGGSVYSVYLWGALFGAATMVLVGKMVLQLKGNLYAVFIACLAFLCSGFLRLHALFQPNFLDVFFWSVSAYCIICLIQTSHTKYLYFLGINFGLGMLSKYTIAFFIIAFGVSILLTPLRKWLANKHFYFAMMLGLLIALPNFLWQYHHHFPVVHHMQLLRERLLDNVSAKDFLADQILITLPSFYIWIMGLWYLFFNKAGRQYVAIGIIFISVIVLLLYFKGKGYYAAGLYPVMLAIGAFQLSKSIQNHKIKIVQYLIPSIILLVTYCIFPVVLPYLSPSELITEYKKMPIERTGTLKWEDGKNHPLPQDFADMLGWEEMARKTTQVYYHLPDSIQKKTMIYGDNYGEAGALAFYRKKYQLPEIYSDDASFAFWLPSSFKHQYFLLATHHLPNEDDAFFKHFKTVEIKDSVIEKYAREYGAKIILYSLPDSTAISIANKNILQLKATYNMQ